MPRPPAKHGTLNRWRGGCRCARCSRAHSDDTKSGRRKGALEALAPHRETIRDRLARGRTPTEAVEGTPMTVGQLYGIARWSTRWRRAMDNAQLAGRSPDIAHDTPMGYKLGCRCPECRAAHHRPATI